MAKIKINIKDLQKDAKISKEELKRIKGGVIGDIGITNPFVYKLTEYDDTGSRFRLPPRLNFVGATPIEIP